MAGSPTAPTAAPWNALADAIERASVAPEVAETMAAVDVGETPSETVYAENKLELLHYEPMVERPHRPPVLVVYALINRPYVLDLQPDRSVVRRLLERGFDVYLVDWGEPSRLDASLTIADYVTRYLDNCVDVVRERADVDAVSLLGYCMGGTMSAMFAALEPEKVRNLVLMAASLHFDDTGGVLEEWGSAEHFSPAGLAETFGTIPSDFFDAGFALMDPVENAVSKYVRLAENADDESFVENFARMERWLNDGIDMAGATYRQYIEDVYQEDRFYRNELRIGDEHVDVERIDMPVLQILAEYDHLVPPEASRPFNDVVGSDDVEVVEAATGHIGLSVSRSAHAELWPSVCDWLADRSADGGLDDFERIDGVGSAYADRLREADVPDLAALAAADPDELAERVGLSRSRVEAWIEQAAEIVEA